jgi:hypothetical protein
MLEAGDHFYRILSCPVEVPVEVGRPVTGVFALETTVWGTAGPAPALLLAKQVADVALAAPIRDRRLRLTDAREARAAVEWWK